jgi:hypothetical protein
VDCIANTDLNRLQRKPTRFLRTTGVVSCSLWPSPGKPQHPSFPQLNFHRARVHRNRQRPRANGFIGRAQNSPPPFTSQTTTRLR